MNHFRIWIENRLHIWLNGAGLSGTFIAWVTNNADILINLLLFSIPTAVYSAYKFNQKYKHQEELNRLEIEERKQELEQDRMKFEKELNANSSQLRKGNE